MPNEKTVIGLGVGQARARWNEEGPEMLAAALKYIGEAANRGVDLLLFPEMYPGPTTHAVRYEVIEPLQQAARQNGVAVAAGTSLPV